MQQRRGKCAVDDKEQAPIASACRSCDRTDSVGRTTARVRPLPEAEVCGLRAAAATNEKLPSAVAALLLPPVRPIGASSEPASAGRCLRGEGLARRQPDRRQLSRETDSRQLTRASRSTAQALPCSTAAEGDCYWCFDAIVSNELPSTSPGACAAFRAKYGSGLTQPDTCKLVTEGGAAKNARPAKRM